MHRTEVQKINTKELAKSLGKLDYLAFSLGGESRKLLHFLLNLESMQFSCGREVLVLSLH